VRTPDTLTPLPLLFAYADVAIYRADVTVPHLTIPVYVVTHSTHAFDYMPTPCPYHTIYLLFC